MSVLYKTTKLLTGFKNNSVPVKDLDGNMITILVEQGHRQKSHFKQFSTTHLLQLQIYLPEKTNYRSAKTPHP